MAFKLEYPKGISEFTDSDTYANNAVSHAFFEFHRRTSATEYENLGEISLYMPESMENPTNVSWDSQSLGVGGAKSERDYKAAYSTNRDRVGQMVESFTTGMAAKAFGGSEASGQDILAHKDQKIVNPYNKMLFKGVNFRNFEMAFRFTPHTIKESDIIWQIIQQFRSSALPEEEEGGFKWKYPDEIQIKYKYQGNDHPWLNSFKRCVITDANINYTSAGHYASMRNGFPAETEMRLQFSEIELLTRKDIKLDTGPSL